MALKVPIMVKGVKVEYWKLSAFSASYTGEVSQIFIMGYIDKATRDRDVGDYIISENYICKPDLFSKYFGSETTLLLGDYKNPLQAAYAYLKDNVGDFKNAVDC